MKTLKKSITTMLVLFAMLLSFNAMSQPEFQGRMKHQKGEMLHQQRGGEEGKMMKAEKLGLSDEQKERAKEIHLASAKAVKPLLDQLRELKAHHQTLVTAESANLKAINKSIDEISSVEAKIAKEKAKFHQEFRSILTEEQRMKFDQMKPMGFQGRHRGMQGHPCKMMQ